MEDSLFASIGLQICGLCFLIFASIMFFTKNKEKTYSTKLFTALIIVTFLINFSEMGVYLFKSREAFILLSGLFLFFTFCWFSLFCIYILVKLLFKDPIADKKKIKYSTLIFCVLGLILFVISCLCDISLTKGSTHDVLTGNYIYVVYTAGGIGILLLMIILFTKYKELDLFERMISIFTVVSLLGFILLQLAIKFDIDDISYVLAIYLAAFYFTIEGTDYKSMILVRESRKEAERKSAEIRKYVDEMSLNAFNPLNNSINLVTNVRYNRNMDDKTIKNNLIYINNESSKLIIKSSKEGDVK